MGNGEDVFLMMGCNRIKKFLRWPRRERALLLEAAYLTGLFRLAIVFIPFKRLAPHLGQSGAETPCEAEAAAVETTKTIGRMVRTISRHTPWESKCLVQAATALIMLRRRGIGATLYLGVAKNEVGQMIAHAWLRCGELIVTGGTRLDKYTVVGRFASEGKRRK